MSFSQYFTVSNRIKHIVLGTKTYGNRRKVISYKVWTV